MIHSKIFFFVPIIELGPQQKEIGKKTCNSMSVGHVQITENETNKSSENTRLPEKIA